MNWYRKLKIWWWNRQAYSMINEYAYWCLRTSNRRMGLEDGNPDDARQNRDELKEKMDALHEIRNAYAFKYNLKPHPNAPDNWRVKYEKESTTRNGTSDGRSNDVGE